MLSIPQNMKLRVLLPDRDDLISFDLKKLINKKKWANGE
jgi:hypothetical protein